MQQGMRKEGNLHCVISSVMEGATPRLSGNMISRRSSERCVSKRVHLRTWSGCSIAKSFGGTKTRPGALQWAVLCDALIASLSAPPHCSPRRSTTVTLQRFLGDGW